MSGSAAPARAEDATRDPTKSGPALASASLLRRLAALAYEAVLYSALVLIVGFLTLPLVAAVPSGEAALRIPDLPARVLSFALVVGAGGLYYIWSWTAGRKTLPMKTWRLRLVRNDGTAPDARAAVVRYLAAWVGPALALLAYVVLRADGWGAFALPLVTANYLWALADHDRLFLHDRIAGTWIVDERMLRLAIP